MELSVRGSPHHFDHVVPRQWQTAAAAESKPTEHTSEYIKDEIILRLLMTWLGLAAVLELLALSFDGYPWKFSILPTANPQQYLDSPFNRQPKHRQVGAASPDDGEKTAPPSRTPSEKGQSEKGTVSSHASKTEEMKRKRGRDEEEDKDDDDGARRPPSKVGLDRNGDAGRLFACPFNKKDPSKYSVYNTTDVDNGVRKNYRTCTGPGFPKIQRLK
jgi:hypothetical protein